MEIIGPQPVLHASFKQDATLFENAIRQYLNEKDAERILYLFKTTTPRSENINEIEAEIDTLLAKMYQNKNNKNIEDDEFIRSFDDSYYASSRVYFNQRNNGFNKPFQYTVNVPCDETQGFYKWRVYLEKVSSSDSNTILRNDCVSPYKYDYENKVYYNSNNPSEVYSSLEAYLKKIIVVNKYTYEDKYGTYKEFINNIETVGIDNIYSKCIVTIDGKEYNCTVSLKNGHPNIEIENLKVVTYPSIAELFPEQVNDNINDNENNISKGLGRI